MKKTSESLRSWGEAIGVIGWIMFAICLIAAIACGSASGDAGPAGFFGFAVVAVLVVLWSRAVRVRMLGEAVRTELAEYYVEERRKGQMMAFKQKYESLGNPVGRTLEEIESVIGKHTDVLRNDSKIVDGTVVETFTYLWETPMYVVQLRFKVGGGECIEVVAFKDKTAK